MPDQLAAAAAYVLQNPFDSTTLPMARISMASGQTPSTFTRMAQAAGYEGWVDLRLRIAEEAGDELRAALDGPFSSVANLISSRTDYVGQALASDVKSLGLIDADALESAAKLLETAPHVTIVGFRSSYAAAYLFHYLYSLFRPDITLVTAGAGTFDLELRRIREDSATVLFSFKPYLREAITIAREVSNSDRKLLAIVDSPDCKIAKLAAEALIFDAPSTGYFPSLTACFALTQALAGVLYKRSGRVGRTQLRKTEAVMRKYSVYDSDDDGN